nr:unnamed protein product [Callosobruchus analis]
MEIIDKANQRQTNDIKGEIENIKKAVLEAESKRIDLEGKLLLAQDKIHKLEKNFIKNNIIIFGAILTEGKETYTVDDLKNLDAGKVETKQGTGTEQQQTSSCFQKELENILNKPEEPIEEPSLKSKQVKTSGNDKQPDNLHLLSNQSH